MLACFSGGDGAGFWSLLPWASVVPEPLCRPTNLYKNENIDLRKLRRLIQCGSLSPCWKGLDEVQLLADHKGVQTIVYRLLKRKHYDLAGLQAAEYEACPICFLHYPLLNTSRCCGKRVCTECFLQVGTGCCTRVFPLPGRCLHCQVGWSQVQTATATQHSLPACPFCKVPGYTAKVIMPWKWRMCTESSVQSKLVHSHLAYHRTFGQHVSSWVRHGEHLAMHAHLPMHGRASHTAYPAP